MSEDIEINNDIDNDADEQLSSPLAQEEKVIDADSIIPRRPETGDSHCGTCAVRGGKLHAYDWLDDLPTPPNASDLVEVQFKNTRKAYYRNSTGIALKQGDIVAVESSPGHDIGEVTLQGRLVYLQMHKNHVNPASYEFKRVYRIARPTDIEKWEEARGLEHQTMLEARRVAQDMNLNMKIGDVEYQGDRTKAIFYYIADERVDFRELIKVLADKFRVRVEMRQIGARQEAGRLGGIGSCGRELCCASWLTSFVSVSTHSARIQDLSLNPMKLAGQCGKLKCCLNYELASYLDAVKNFPPTDKPLETQEGNFYFLKYDIFKKVMWYSPKKDSPVNMVAMDPEHVRDVQKMNSEGNKPDKLTSLVMTAPVEDDGYKGTVDLDDDLTRFDSKRKNKGRNRGQQQRHGQQQGNQQPKPQHNNAAKNNDGKQPNGHQGQQRQQAPQGGPQQQHRPANQRQQGQQKPNGAQPQQGNGAQSQQRHDRHERFNGNRNKQHNNGAPRNNQPKNNNPSGNDGKNQ